MNLDGFRWIQVDSGGFKWIQMNDQNEDETTVW